MYEDIGTLIGRGFETWKRNLNLAIPFVLMIAAMMLLAAIMAVIVLYPLITTSPDIFTTPGDIEDPEELVDLLSGMTNIGLLAAALLVGILIMWLVTSYFTAGAIGMAKEATLAGRTTLREMAASGRSHCISLFLAEALTTIILVAGLVLLSLPFAADLAAGMETGDPEFGPLVVWIVLLLAYGLILSIVLAVIPYALVVEGLGPIDAIKAGVRFFLKNKMDVFLIWLVVLAVSMSVQFLGVPFSGSETASVLFSAVSGIVSVLVISPLSTVWWTRLYMTRAGKIAEPPAEEDEEVKYL
ncbi:hypothetical protein [Methanocrinis sp.]|uniref:DUF7847 domain-containing protein n=1 Tax=Methanocrinis sp. TaxID=3101522 RepID=UPI003D0D100A